jgi:putative restriction endonuclease
VDRAYELHVREAVFAWLRARQLVQPVFARGELVVAVGGERIRLVDLRKGIWKPRQLSAALSIVTGFYADGARRPYEDRVGADGLVRYKWQGDDPQARENRAVRTAMEAELPLVWFVGVGARPGSSAQVFQPVFPVWVVAEEPAEQQFVLALDEAQRQLVTDDGHSVSAIERRYNEVVVRQRVHQPAFRSRVLVAYEQRCAVCRLPFLELLDAAHIRPDAHGGEATLRNALALCKIHHGAFDAQILGITPDCNVEIAPSVLEAHDGPTLRHALQDLHGRHLAQLPSEPGDQPDRQLLEERYAAFRAAS